MKPPEIKESTQKEREEYIKETFCCKGNCDICGNCAFLRGKSAEVAYEEYISGVKDFLDITQELR